MLSYTVPTDRVRRGLVFRWHLSTQRKADQTYPVTLKLILWLVQTNIGLLYYQIRWGPFITIKPRCKQNIPIFNNISVRLFQWSRNHGGFLFPTSHWGGGIISPCSNSCRPPQGAAGRAPLSARRPMAVGQMFRRGCANKVHAGTEPEEPKRWRCRTRMSAARAAFRN